MFAHLSACPQVLKHISSANVHEQKFGFVEAEKEADQHTQQWITHTFSGSASPTAAAAAKTKHDADTTMAR